MALSRGWVAEDNAGSWKQFPTVLQEQGPSGAASLLWGLNIPSPNAYSKENDQWMGHEWSEASVTLGPSG